MDQEEYYGQYENQAGAYEDDPNEAVITATPATNSLELRAIYYLHNVLGQWMAQNPEENYNFPACNWQVTAVEVHPFKTLDDKYANAIWGILDFADQPGGAFVFLDLNAAQTVTGLTEEDLTSEEGMNYVEGFLYHMSMQFMTCWQEHEVASFDVQMFPSPTAPSLMDLQPMFPGLNNKTPLICTSFRVQQPGSASPARVILAIPQAYLHPYEGSLQAVGELTYASTDTNYFHERMSYLEDVPIPISVLLGKAEMTVGDLQSLEEGDVIELGTSLGEPLAVKLGKTVVWGKPGTGPDGRRLAVQIVQMNHD